MSASGREPCPVVERMELIFSHLGREDLQSVRPPFRGLIYLRGRSSSDGGRHAAGARHWLGWIGGKERLAVLKGWRALEIKRSKSMIDLASPNDRRTYSGA